MSEQKINITPAGETLTILTGKALEELRPNTIDVSGDIKAIERYVEKELAGRNSSNAQRLSPDFSIVKIDNIKGIAVLETSPNNPLATRVKASLKRNHYLEPFKINEDSNNFFTREQMMKLIRMNKFMFASEEQANRVYEGFQKFSVKLAVELVNQSDNRGNVDVQRKIQADSKLPLSFTLHTPVYEGLPAQDIQVDILFEADTQTVFFWLESPDLRDLQESLKDQAFEDHVRKHLKENYIIIEGVNL